ncbi:MAG TPA: sugar transferase [Acidobacteriaceae bacterium]|jgi:exopolysaccharide biosynthesis polyprenyl glycosylphosphotransferase|nr:sugar transferase [Acidobacteriaceae bacterium]
MATSEYLRYGGNSGPWIQGPGISGAARRFLIGPDRAASAGMMAGDAASILMACGLAFAVQMYLAPTNASLRDATLTTIPSALLYACFFALAFLVVARRYGLYSPKMTITAGQETRRVFQCCLTAGLLLCGLLYLSGGAAISRLLTGLLVVSAGGMLCLWRGWWRTCRTEPFEHGMDLRNVAILGTNRLSYALSRQVLQHQGLGYSFVGFIATPDAAVSSEIATHEILGGVETIHQLVRQHFVDEVVIADFYPSESTMRLVQDARELDIDVRAIAGYYGEVAASAAVEYLGVFPVASLYCREQQTIGLCCKRGLDLLLAMAAVVVTAPVMLAIAVAVKLESEGPVLYVSERIGKRGRVFRCFKFRSMVKDAEKLQKDLTELNERDGILFKVSNDPRTTRLGRILRKYSLDEIPQFLNVVRGEMSLVGPRPPIASEVEQYELEHFRRLEVRPGLTGLWQVQARRDPSFARYIALDTAYVENRSLWLDLKILLQTAGVVVRGTGI